MTSEVLITAGAGELHRAAARLFVEAAGAAAGPKGTFTVALSGGSTPRGVYALLAEDPSIRTSVPWEHTDFFWSDERCVPPDHPDSNYRTAWEVMLSKVPVPPQNIHRVRGESEDPQAEAAAYETVIRETLSLVTDHRPSFDLILLGMGADGHTASLFPGSEALRERSRLVVATRVESLRAPRITFTLPLINAARHIVILVSGKDKAEALSRVHDPSPGAAPLPAGLVRPFDGELTWVVDEDAAGLLGSGTLPPP